MSKIELHAHLNGCVRPDTFMELVAKFNVDIEDIDFYNVNLEMGFKIFKALGQVITSLELVKRITKEMIEDYERQNCIYLEIRSSPKVFKDSGIREYFETILKVI